jgi:hypothetical protein
MASIKFFWERRSVVLQISTEISEEPNSSLYHVDPLLDNDREISKYAKAVAE